MLTPILVYLAVEPVRVPYIRGGGGGGHITLLQIAMGLFFLIIAVAAPTGVLSLVTTFVIRIFQKGYFEWMEAFLALCIPVALLSFFLTLFCGDFIHWPGLLQDHPIATSVGTVAFWLGTLWLLAKLDK